MSTFNRKRQIMEHEPVYNQLPKRKWIGLTDEKRSQLVTLHHGLNEYGQVIKAELKEKKNA